VEQPRLGCLFSQPVRATNLDLALAHAQSLCCFAPDVAVVETAHTGKPDNPGTRRWSRFERPPVRRISQPRMNAFSVVVGGVCTKPSMQMPFIEDNDVVQQFAATSADPSFGDPVLPGASIGGPHGLCAKAAKERTRLLDRLTELPAFDPEEIRRAAEARVLALRQGAREWPRIPRCPALPPRQPLAAGWPRS
jgi:hypothetical protein